jgi:hypothetical protein
MSNPSRGRPGSVGNDKGGAPAAIRLPANWIDVQIVHWSWAIWDFAGFAGLARASGAVAGAGVADSASSAGVPPAPRTWTWPKDKANWTASANKAHQAPNRRFARIHRIVVPPKLRSCSRDATL